MVFAENKDFLVLFYAEWCKFSGEVKILSRINKIYGNLLFFEKILEIWQIIAEEFNETNEIVVAQIEAIKNEVEDLAIDIFPTIKLFLRGRKNEPINYTGPRTKDAILLFVQENSKFSFLFFLKNYYDYLKKLRAFQKSFK